MSPSRFTGLGGRVHHFCPEPEREKIRPGLRDPLGVGVDPVFATTYIFAEVESRWEDVVRRRVCGGVERDGV